MDLTHIRGHSSVNEFIGLFTNRDFKIIIDAKKSSDHVSTYRFGCAFIH